MRPIVERRRLLEKLGRGGVRLVLVAAAPGYGKTVLLRQWLEGFKPDQRAWVTAEPESGASLRFWGRVLTALESTGRPVAADIRLSLGRNAAGSDALAPLVDHFAGQPDETVLV